MYTPEKVKIHFVCYKNANTHDMSRDRAMPDSFACDVILLPSYQDGWGLQVCRGGASVSSFHLNFVGAIQGAESEIQGFRELC